VRFCGRQGLTSLPARCTDRPLLSSHDVSQGTSCANRVKRITGHESQPRSLATQHYSRLPAVSDTKIHDDKRETLAVGQLYADRVTAIQASQHAKVGVAMSFYDTVAWLTR
jgi:hypothetical protein